MSVFTRERGPTSVTCVNNHSEKVQVLFNIFVFTLERNHLSATCVENHSRSHRIFGFIFELTLDNDHSSAPTVENRFHKKQPCQVIIALSLDNWVWLSWKWKRIMTQKVSYLWRITTTLMMKSNN